MIDHNEQAGPDSFVDSTWVSGTDRRLPRKEPVRVHASPTDPTWQAAYDQIVDDGLQNGLQVYALVGDEAVPGDAPVGSDAWLDDYAAAFVTIVACP